MVLWTRRLKYCFVIGREVSAAIVRLNCVLENISLGRIHYEYDGVVALRICRCGRFPVSWSRLELCLRPVYSVMYKMRTMLILSITFVYSLLFRVVWRQRKTWLENEAVPLEPEHTPATYDEMLPFPQYFLIVSSQVIFQRPSSRNTYL